MNSSPSAPIGEIIEASLTAFTAEVPADRLYEAPSFGSLARCEDSTGSEIIYGIVMAAETGSVESSRRAAAFWQTEAELRQNQPQIFELLSTRFTALTVGHVEAGRLRLSLPPRPPRVHGFVYECDSDEARRLTEDMSIIRPLLEPPGCSDELIAALLRSGAAIRQDPRQFLVTAGKHLAILLRDDYPRLQAIIRKLG